MKSQKKDPQHKCLEEIDAELKADEELDEVIKTFWNDYQEDLKKREKEFIDTVVADDPDWVKERKIEWLNKEFTELNLLYIKKVEEADELENKITYEEGMGDEKASLRYVYRSLAEMLRTHCPGNKGGFLPLRSRPWRGAWRMKDLSMKELEKEMKSIKIQIGLWENPEQLYAQNGNLTEEQIEIARHVDCGNFIETKRQAGSNRLAVCPFHDDTSPSLTIYPEGRGFYCFACGTGGNAIDLVMKIYDINFRDAVRLILNYEN